MKKILSILAAVCLAAAAAAGIAESPVMEEKALELGGSSIRFPQISGMADAELQSRINTQIREDLGVDGYLARMTALLSDEGRSLTVSWRGGIMGDVFSGVLEAEGAVRSPRRTHAWTWSSVDLRDGTVISLQALFTDPEAGREALETYLEEQAAAELSPHLQNAELTPLPEGFLLEQTGITLLYGAEQLSTLSGRAGAVKIGWNEIRGCCDWSGDGILRRIGADAMVNLTEESRDRIRETAESGLLPDIPVKIGDSVQAWTDRTGLLNDPDEYAGGRMFALEGAPFRSVTLLSDALDSGWEESRVQGIRMDRGCVWGLCIGETEAAAWRTLLGEPDSEVRFDAEMAEAARTVPGICDYYQYGNYRLQLHAGEDGILAGITLAE